MEDSKIRALEEKLRGQLIRASESEKSDLFWRLRGGGSNFGIVTTFEFCAYPWAPTCE